MKDSTAKISTASRKTGHQAAQNRGIFFEKGAVSFRSVVVQRGKRDVVKSNDFVARWYPMELCRKGGVRSGTTHASESNLPPDHELLAGAMVARIGMPAVAFERSSLVRSDCCIPP